MTVTFDEATHTYTVDGKTVPSITQIVAPLGKDMDEPDELTELAIDNAAERGTAMHAYIAHRLRGGAPEDFELPDAWQGYADAVELFLAEHPLTPLLIEEPLGCSLFAGTPDLVCQIGEEVYILDWKFVSALAKSKVGAQLAGYAVLCERNDVFPDRLAAVQFLPDGTYRFYPVDTPRMAKTVFFYCLIVHAYAGFKHTRGALY